MDTQGVYRRLASSRLVSEGITRPSSCCAPSLGAAEPAKPATGATLRTHLVALRAPPDCREELIGK